MREIIQYIAKDGTVFVDRDSCLEYEKTLLTEQCTECKGMGGEHIEDGHDCWGNYETAFIQCRYCKGTGKKDLSWDVRRETIRKIELLEAKLKTL